MAKPSAPRGAVRPWPEGSLQAVPGFRAAALHCGLKRKPGNPDLALLVADKPAAAAGVFTANLYRAAPVELCIAALARTRGRARAVLVNAGNANACTGAQGEKDAARMAALAAKGVGCKAAEVLVCSTGVIGRLLPMAKVERGIAKLAAGLKRGKPGADFAQAILTTDLVRKTAAVRVELGGVPVRLAGATKGSGMIAPNMATTLGFVATDARIEPPVLRQALRDVIGETFNCLTVDGDTSTNDCVLALASGRAAHEPLKKASGAPYRAFREALLALLDDLARQIAADGEGAQHTVTLFVGGTRTDGEARRIAATIANSPLVKTALAGCDPNWGRIMAAAGRAGVPFDPRAGSLTVCGYELFARGMPLPFPADEVSRAMKARDIGIVVMVGDGPGRARYYTCDLTHGYITINADYHT
ncbi:MAG: bifunctional glutamate N-acetyltransferase/amino-acid acetyltransferase ArgJ [Planctomycetota bacterium]|nr:bifunctional glutamate N-acetyltransferase/amino-acid acetyltransferase ArgJ [Planctomycetota bacterium]